MQVIVFCTTAMMTEFMYIMLRDLKLNVREIHSRKPQLYRTRISEEFRDSNRLILVTSDVSTRGVNYPDVTLVLQVGFLFLFIMEKSSKQNLLSAYDRATRDCQLSLECHYFAWLSFLNMVASLTAAHHDWIRSVFLLAESTIFTVLEGPEGKVNPGKESC
jgi:hypothetical protein